MSPCAMLTYSNVSPEAWESIKAAVKRYGISVTTSSGVATQDSYTITWNFDQPTGGLNIQCTDHPWFPNCSTINSHINDAVESCLKQHGVTMARLIKT